MSKFIMVFLLLVFLLYIFVCSYRYLMYKRIKMVILRFMTSCMLLLTFTVVFYNDIFLNGKNIISSYGGIYSNNENRVFLNSSENAIEDVKPETEKKITAYFDNTNPVRGTVTNLIVTGSPGSKVTAICQYKRHGIPYIMNIGDNGQVVIPVQVDNNAEPGYTVVVDISVKYGERVYKLNSVFTPR